MPTRRALARLDGVGNASSDVGHCQACGRPLPSGRPGRRTCSTACRVALHRREQADRLAERDAALRRLLESALRMLNDGRSS